MRKRALQLLLACPRMSPEWELAVVDVLMRPKVHTRGRVEHHSGEQAWPAGVEARAREIVEEVGRRFDVMWDVIFPPLGEYHLICDVPAGSEEAAKGLVAALSRGVGDVWFVFGRLFVKDGRFYRRRLGYRMDLVLATDVHLTREVRGKLKGLM